MLSSSPERFLRVRPRPLGRDQADQGHGRAATPTRGATSRLATALLKSAKDRAENLMIVDLLRNDLGRVCEVGTVDVAKLMDVESYATVHQMVSTIRGLLRDDVDLVDCVRADVPGRLDDRRPEDARDGDHRGLEGGARGVYSGAIGYFALQRHGRPQHRHPHARRDRERLDDRLRRRDRDASQAAGEYDELLLKAQPLLDAVAIDAAARGRAAQDRAEAEPLSGR